MTDSDHFLYGVGLLWYTNLGGFRLSMNMRVVEGVGLVRKILVCYHRQVEISHARGL
jgi:hypothetical protein